MRTWKKLAKELPPSLALSETKGTKFPTTYHLLYSQNLQISLEPSLLRGILKIRPKIQYTEEVLVKILDLSIMFVLSQYVC